MKIRVLGSAAGGGFPQWNCNCAQCVAARNGAAGFTPRTQSSIAVSGGGADFALINASPDIRAQILATPALQPARAARDTAIRGIVLMDAQIDHVTGLLLLRESNRPLVIHCTARVYEDLTQHFAILPMLQHYCGTEWREIKTDGSGFGIDGVAGVRFSAVPLTSKAPPYSPHRVAPQPGDNIGLLMTDGASGRSAFYAPGLGSIDAPVQTAMAAADCLLVDGTCWWDDDLARAGVGRKRASEMGHLRQSGAGGMLEVLAAYPRARRILIHINNTNPILDEAGAQRAELQRLGIEVATDGLEIEV